MRFKYRLSKYDPSKRDFTGAFTGEEWVSYSQVGKLVGGHRLSAREYKRVEDRYLIALIAMLKEVELEKVQVDRFRKIPGTAQSPKMKIGQLVSLATVEKLSRLALKELIEVSFSVPRKMYLHFGFDYLVYIGLSREPAVTIAQLRDLGLFVELMTSPYRK